MEVKASVVAQELRRIAEGLEREPDTMMEQPMVSFYCDAAAAFKACARLLKPWKKDPTERQFRLENRADGGWLRAIIDRSKVCELVEPAKPAVYRCDPLLSEEEFASVEEIEEAR
jgi:hypothetical protein